MHLVFDHLKKGYFDYQHLVAISKNAWGPNLVRGSSLMFLSPGHRVTVHELLLGLAVCSGNDAAIALAEFVSGSVATFVNEMNYKMSLYGLFNLNFKDPTGLNPGSHITAREFAGFIKHYLDTHIEALPNYHVVKQFTYPKRGNLVKHFNSPIRQDNRNTLLKSYKGLDGLKTGYIKESGYNIALTATRKETRLIAVVLGAPGRHHAEGHFNRNRDGRLLLDFGFTHFQTLTIAKPYLKPIRIWFAETKYLAGNIREEIKITVPRHQAQFIRSEAVYFEDIKAPLKKGKTIGHLHYYIGLTKIASYPILAQHDVKTADFLKKIIDYLVRIIY